MSSSSQQQATVPLRRLSKKQTRKYFTSNRFGGVTRALIPIMIGLILTVIGFALRNPLLACIGGVICLLILVILIVVFRGRISDEEYDEWQQRQERKIKRTALRELQVDVNELVGPILSIHSFVLPGSAYANDYAEGTAMMKMGKDGYWRFSINVYTILFPFADHIAIYSQDMNAIDMSSRCWQNEQYSRHHIVTANAAGFTDDAFIANEWCRCHVYQACLKIAPQDMLALGAYIKATPTGSAYTDDITLPDTDLSQTVVNLRRLLRTSRPPRNRP